jgi:hypothetical protein
MYINARGTGHWAQGIKEGVRSEELTAGTFIKMTCTTARLHDCKTIKL